MALQTRALRDNQLAALLEGFGTLAALRTLSLSQAFVATLLFDPSMSALPIIETQKSQSVGLFPRQ